MVSATGGPAARSKSKSSQPMARFAGFTKAEARRRFVALQATRRSPVRATDLLHGGHRSLYWSLLHHFGSLRQARRAARLPSPSYPRRWSAEKVVAELRALSRRGVPIRCRTLFRLGRHDLVTAAVNYTGGLVRARRLAGIKPPPVNPRRALAWDEDTVVRVILARRREGRALASSRVPPRLKEAAVRYCGSWKEAILAAGLDYDEIRLRPRYEDKDLLSLLRRFRTEQPSATMTDLHAHPLLRRWRKKFGSLEDALRRAGIRGWPAWHRLPVLSRAEVIRAIRARSRRGQSLSVEVVRHEDLRLRHGAARQFGGWRNAVRAAGLSPLSPGPKR